MFSELTVIVKDSEKTLRKKFMVYNKIWLDTEDPEINACVKETLVNFGVEPDSIQVKIHMEIK